MMTFNEEMSKKYGLHIYDVWNQYNPYYVEEWDGCYKEEEIAHPESIKDWNNYCPTTQNVEADVGS